MQQGSRRAIRVGLLSTGAVALVAGLAAASPGPGGPSPGPAKVGSRAADIRFKDLAGATHRLRNSGAEASVFLFISSQCPVANVYTPRIRALSVGYGKKGARFFGVYANELEGAAEVRGHAKERGYVFPVVRDDGTLVGHLGATMTPEAVVLDRQGVIRYRGRIDDHQDPAQVRSRNLEQALAAVLEGRPVARAEAPAFGCVIQASERRAVAGKAAVTYTRDVASILQKNCQECHRAGEVAPFALENFRQAANWAPAIKAITASRKMPPFKAESHGEFFNERRLTDQEIATLAAWADAGAPEGDPKDLPPPPKYARGWRLGAPDKVFEMPETYTLAPDGRDVYQCFVLPTDYTQDRWVSAVEVQPGNRAVVHHVIAFMDVSGTARKLDAADPGPGYVNPTPGNPPGFLPIGLLGGWAPGNDPEQLPRGVAIRLPKGTDIVLEVHYHKNGKTERDRTRFGVHWAKGTVNKAFELAIIVNMGLVIPPGAANHEVKASGIVAQDITMLGVTPHMHLIGRTIKASAVFPDGRERQLVNIPDWDFNWQLTYGYRQPLKVPKGTRISVVATYDNSESNPKNPNRPPKEVRWGEQSTDEMCVLFYAFTIDAQNLGTADPGDRSARAGTGTE